MLVLEDQVKNKRAFLKRGFMLIDLMGTLAAVACLIVLGGLFANRMDAQRHTIVSWGKAIMQMHAFIEERYTEGVETTTEQCTIFVKEIKPSKIPGLILPLSYIALLKTHSVTVQESTMAPAVRLSWQTIQ